jgi:hypothetical protein
MFHFKPIQIGEREIIEDKYGQAKLHHGESEIRFEISILLNICRFERLDPFPLYPGLLLLEFG